MRARWFERGFIGLASALVLTACESITDETPSGLVSGSEIVTPKADLYIAAFNAPRGDVRLNQVGVRPGGYIKAVVETDEPAPLDWVLKDATGSVLASGFTDLFGYDAGSGASVHQVSFPAPKGTQTGLVLDFGDTGTSRVFSVDETVFTQLKYDLLGYYYHNRIGIEIEESFAGGKAWARPAGHVDERLTCFKGEDLNGVYWPGCDYTLDVGRGWYDAGDHSKYMVNSGITVWTLQNQVERGAGGFEDGQVNIPETGNGINDLLDEARWNLDFMMAMQAPEGAKAPVSLGDFSEDLSELKVSVIDVSGMAHHKAGDADWPPLPLFPHENTTPRVLHAPSVTATLNLAVVTAQCARLYRGVDDDYASKCASASKRAYAAAKRVPNAFSYRNFDGSGPYDSTDPRGEFYWAAAEMYLAFGEGFKSDLLAARDKLDAFPLPATRQPGWGDTQVLGTLALATFSNDETLREESIAAIIQTANGYLEQIEAEGYMIAMSKEKWAWGSVGELANRGMVLANAYEFSGDSRYRDAALDMLDYILGRNPRDVSYISGYGSNAVKAMHHRHWAGAEYDGYPLPPPGVVSGGPNTLQVAGPVSEAIIENCHAQTCFADVIDAYELNETCINWQAAVFWLAAWADEVAL